VKKKFGIKMTLLLSPVTLLLFTILATIAGESYGFAGEAQLFTYFFLLVVFSKMINRTMKESMEDTSMNVIYTSLDPLERPNVQSGIDGVASQIGVFAAGLLLACIVMISFVTMIHVTYVLFVFLLIWFFTGRALYQNYHKMLKVTLESDKVQEVVDLTLEELVDVNLEQTAFPLELLEFNPYFFHYTSRERQLSCLSHPNPKGSGWTSLPIAKVNRTMPLETLFTREWGMRFMQPCIMWPRNTIGGIYMKSSPYSGIAIPIFRVWPFLRQA